MSEEARARVRGFLTIPDFGYSGDLPLGETWGFMEIGRHRDSDVLQESNFEVVYADLKKRFPEDVEIVHCGHWAVGWYDHIAVHLLGDDGEGTPAADAMFEWESALADYPVASDDDYSERLFEAEIEGLRDYGDVAEGILQWLHDRGRSSDESGNFRAEDLREALFAVAPEQAREDYDE